MTVEEFATYFEGKVLPVGPIKLNHYCTIADPAMFVESEFGILHHILRGERCKQAQSG
jgi:hypothetical protein